MVRQTNMSIIKLDSEHRTIINSIRHNDRLALYWTDKDHCVCRSENYNWQMNMKTGHFQRWGKTLKDNPSFSPFGPELLDIEISTICHGIEDVKTGKRTPCSHCYKTASPRGKNMSLDTFKEIFGKINYNCRQIAFGAGDLDGNPELFDIMDYCRNNNSHTVVPNITINGSGLTEELSNKLADVCGAVAISHYANSSLCYSAIEKLSRARERDSATLQQINIHKLLARETYESCFTLVDDCVSDPRLQGVGAIVFLLLKPKGKRNQYHSITDNKQLQKLYEYATSKGITIGLDSCSAPMMLQAVHSLGQDHLQEVIEPCESFGLFSGYINVEGQYFPCSFAEDTPGWENGIDILQINNFLDDVWFHPTINKLREMSTGLTSNCACELKSTCRVCPIYDITPCRKLSLNDKMCMQEACNLLKRK